MEEMHRSYDLTAAGIYAPSDQIELIRAPHVRYDWKCHDQNGNLVWEELVDNLVTDVGANFALDTLLAGAGFTAGWFIGLVSSTSFTAYDVADTMASHGGWLEYTGYAEANRQAAPFANAAASRSKTASAASVFTANAGTATLKGSFLVNNSTKGGTTNTLYSVGNFTQGDRPIANGYVISVTPTFGFA